MTQPGMMLKLIIIVALVLITILVGFFLHKTGKPYGNFPFTIHKLTTVAFVVYASIIFTNLVKHYEVSMAFIALLIIAIVVMLVLLVTGALMSLDRMLTSMQWVHKISTLLFIADMGGIIFMIMKVK
ncbi:MAG: hypothetical protein JXB49_00470 [Bacteroidales bacterium]|nr:hypothetical protein [Bacteroidales bacterium]